MNKGKVKSIDSNLYTKWKKIYPDKFVSEERVFHTIHRGNRIFIGTACG